MNMDPWQNSAAEISLPYEDVNMTFEDNFEPTSTYSGHPAQDLPDSAEYLARLEQKLSKLKTGKDSGKSLVESLSAVRESHMMQLLSNGEPVENEVNEEIITSRTQELIMRRLAPEKQAISIEELVELLKADQLAHSETTDG